LAPPEAATTPEVRIRQRKRCAEACAQKKPKFEPAQTGCLPVSLLGCEIECDDELDDADDVCGQCATESLAWSPAEGSCNEFECVCTRGGPFISLQGCDSCVETLRRRRARELKVLSDAEQMRRSAPIPDDVGQTPTHSEESDTLFVQGLVTSDEGDWLVAGGSARTSDKLIAARVDSDFQERWIDSEPAPAGSTVSKILSDGAGGAFLLWGGRASRVAAYAASAEVRFVQDKPFQFIDMAIARQQPGAALVVLTQANEYTFSLRSEVDGVELESLPLAPVFQGSGLMNPCAARVAMDDQGRFIVALCDPLRVGQLVRKPGAPATLELRWMIELHTPAPGSLERGFAHALEVAADGGIVVAGSLYSDKKVAMLNEPFVARIDADGSLQWQWTAGDAVVDGQIDAVALGPDGDIYALGREDPITYSTPRDSDHTGLCSIYGCKALALRKFAKDGHVAWQHQHRSTYSHGDALALDGNGGLIVTGSVQRETGAALRMRFAQ
jgi:hypothetical protein